MKDREELNCLKEEVENLKKKLSELAEDELKQVVGGSDKTGTGSVLSPNFQDTPSDHWDEECPLPFK